MKRKTLKSIFILGTFTLCLSTAVAQVPEKMSYQAVIRNSSDILVSNQQVGMQISIIQGSVSGTVVYIETQTPTTNVNGLVSLEFGTGTVVLGTFASIDWANGTYFIKTETDPTGGSDYTITDISQMMSVPYALHSKTAESITGGISETDPVFTAWSKDYNDLTNKPIFQDSINTYGFDGNYNNLTNKPSIPATADGSETKINAGSNITITGNGKAATPYVVAQKAGTQVGQMLYWNGSAWVNVEPGSDDASFKLVGGIPTWIEPPYSRNYVHCGDTTKIVDVISPTGKVWMDRNLGASQVATSSTDVDAYGDIYQWGRFADGHQCRNSNTSSTLSSTDTPNDGNFILTLNYPVDWRQDQNNNFWQGVKGINNPCPTGYRLPTETELDNERLSWSSNNAADAFASPLKLPLTGVRGYDDGLLNLVGTYGNYWSSTVKDQYARYLYFNDSSAGTGSSQRASGRPVRCIKD